MKYQNLCDIYTQLEATPKRLEKTWILSQFLKKAAMDDLSPIILLLQGKIFPEWDERKIGIASRLIVKAINVATGISAPAIETEWKRTGDLGIVAQNLIGKKTQRTLASHDITIKKVLENLRNAAELEGLGTVDKKVKLVSELLTSAKPGEARYIVRTVLEELRVGVASGTLRDAIAWAFLLEDVQLNYDEKKKSISPDNRENYNKHIEAVKAAHDVSNDYTEVARLAKTKGQKGLQSVSMVIGKPLKVMLFQKAASIEDSFKHVGKPCAFEYKYDGFRIQIHKKDKVRLFTRRLEEVTKQFPDVIEFVEKHVKGNNFILDAEVVGYKPKTKKYLPFQSISQRIKRKYDIPKMVKDFPIEVNVFDILCHDNIDIMKESYKKRRAMIEKMVKNSPYKIVIAKQLITDNVAKAEKFYRAALAAGEEGVMAKNLEGIYKPGSRVGFGVKVKPTMETLDLVVVGAEWGQGKRKGWLTSFTIACRDDDTGEFREIGKVGTGFKELETEEGVTFDQMTNLLEPLIKTEKGKVVTIKPKVVLEINYEEIQKSPTYSSGFALRFPRLVNLRSEKPADEASSLQMVEDLYYGQKK